MDDREKIRKECRDDLDALRGTDLPERARELLEKLDQRLTRLETGSFPVNEAVTKVTTRPTPPPFKATNVTDELAKGRRGE